MGHRNCLEVVAKFERTEADGISDLERPYS